MMIEKRYPQDKAKAFNVTYDDGVLQDVRFVQLLNQYGIKGTFNLNSQLLYDEFEWTHETGCTVKRLSVEAASHLYDGHEVASHTLTHPYLHNMPEWDVMYQLHCDKENLAHIFGREIAGFAVPFDFYSDRIASCVQRCGFRYGRISEESRSFAPQHDWYNWKATVFHLDSSLMALTDAFLSTTEELAVYQIVGHTYDLDVENLWGTMEDIFRKIAAADDVLPMTTLEIVTYLQAMEQAEMTEQAITNHSDIALWFAVDGIPVQVQPGETVML